MKLAVIWSISAYTSILRCMLSVIILIHLTYLIFTILSLSCARFYLSNNLCFKRLILLTGKAKSICYLEFKIFFLSVQCYFSHFYFCLKLSLPTSKNRFFPIKSFFPKLSPLHSPVM